MSNRIRVCLDGGPSAADSGWPPPFATFRSRCSTLICTTKSTILFSCSAAAACRARLFVEANVRTSASHWALSSIEPARARASPQRQASELWQQQRAARPYFRQSRQTVSSPRPWAARAAVCVSPIRFEMAATTSSPLLSCDPAGHSAKTASIAARRSSSASYAHILLIRSSFAQATGGDTRWRTGRVRARCPPKAALCVTSSVSSSAPISRTSTHAQRRRAVLAGNFREIAECRRRKSPP